MFIVFTADDAVQSYTLDGVNQFLAQRVNPNGCKPKMTYFTSINYTNYTLVTGWSSSCFVRILAIIIPSQIGTLPATKSQTTRKPLPHPPHTALNHPQ